MKKKVKKLLSREAVEFITRWLYSNIQNQFLGLSLIKEEDRDIDLLLISTLMEIGRKLQRAEPNEKGRYSLELTPAQGFALRAIFQGISESEPEQLALKDICDLIHHQYSKTFIHEQQNQISNGNYSSNEQ